MCHDAHLTYFYIFAGMQIILFDDPDIRLSLMPLTFTRPVAEIRVGILRIADKWQRRFGQPVSYHTADYLSKKFPLQATDENLFINGAVCPNDELMAEIEKLKEGESIIQNDTLIAGRIKSGDPAELGNLSAREFSGKFTIIDELWSIYRLNAREIKADFELVTRNRQSADPDDPHVIIYGRDNLFVEEGASLRACTINAEKGPVYIGKNALVQEGAIIYGAFALGEESIVSIGAKVRGDSTVGPFSKIGGEVSNSVIFGYSNKGHDGFIGNSVIGEWCNLGADSNTSNLKNDYGNVKLWNYLKEGFTDTGQMFCGTIMGDHSKCGINTMFNTGTVVGVFANIFGAGFPRNFIPSFAWGGANGFNTYQFRKVAEVARRVMERRGMEFSAEDQAILEYVFNLTGSYRIWEEEKV